MVAAVHLLPMQQQERLAAAPRPRLQERPPLQLQRLQPPPCHPFREPVVEVREAVRRRIRVRILSNSHNPFSIPVPWLPLKTVMSF